MADKSKEELEREVAAKEAQLKEMQERIEDLKAERDTQQKAVTGKKVTVKVGKDTFEIRGNVRLGNLMGGKTYTAQDLAKPENSEVVKQLIEKKSEMLVKL